MGEAILDLQDLFRNLARVQTVHFTERSYFGDDQCLGCYHAFQTMESCGSRPTSFRFSVFNDLQTPTFSITLEREFKFFLFKVHESHTLQVTGVGHCQVLLHEEDWSFTDGKHFDMSEGLINDLLIIDKIYEIRITGCFTIT